MSDPSGWKPALKLGLTPSAQFHSGADPEGQIPGTYFFSHSGSFDSWSSLTSVMRVPSLSCS